MQNGPHHVVSSAETLPTGQGEVKMVLPVGLANAAITHPAFVPATPFRVTVRSPPRSHAPHTVLASLVYGAGNVIR
jgi:hypothetical protein